MVYFYGGSSTLNLTLIKRGVETSDLFYYRHTDIKGPPCAFISFIQGRFPLLHGERERVREAGIYDDKGKGRKNVPADEACEMDHIAIKQKNNAK